MSTDPTQTTDTSIVDPTVTSTDSSTTDPTLASLGVTTDQPDYAPGSTAMFSVNGVNSGDVLTFDVTDLNGLPISGTNAPWNVYATGGVVQTTWAVGLDALGQAFQVTVVDQTTGQVASTTFTDSKPSLADSQWMDVGHGLTPPAQWTNGDLNPSNSIYNEGDSVPFRMVFSGLVTNPAHNNNVYTITIEFESMKGGDHAYDYLTAYNANPLANGTTPVPVPASGTPAALDPDNQFAFTEGSHSSHLDMWSGNVTDVSFGTPSTDNNGDQLTPVTVTFTADDADAVLAWGGHLALSSVYGGLGSGAISGAPFHMIVDDAANEFSGGGELSIHDIGGTPGNGGTPSADVVIDKQVSGDANATADGNWFDQLNSQFSIDPTNPTDPLYAPVVLVGSNVYFRTIITNEATNTPAGQLNVSSVADTNPLSDFTFSGSDTVTVPDVSSVTSDIKSIIAKAGLQQDAANLSGDESVPGDLTTTPASASDSANYYGATAGITVDKEVSSNGKPYVEVGNGTLTEPTVLVGKTVNFDAVINNTTDGGLGVTGLTISDDKGLVVTGNNDGPAFDLGGVTTLGTGGSTTATASTTAAAGLHQDTVTVNGTVTDSFGNTASVSDHDSADYFGVTAGITVDKQVSSNSQPYVEVGNGVLTEPTVLVGKTVNFHAVINNTTNGGLGVTGLTISDDKGLVVTGNNDGPAFDLGGVTTLGSGGSTTATASTTAVAGLHQDTVTVKGTVTDSFGNTASVSANDSADYFGATPGVNVEKLVSVDGGTNWYFTQVPGDTYDTAAYISSVSGIALGNLHIGTRRFWPVKPSSSKWWLPTRAIPITSSMRP
jgi:hypothetical protein